MIKNFASDDFLTDLYDTYGAFKDVTVRDMTEKIIEYLLSNCQTQAAFTYAITNILPCNISCETVNRYFTNINDIAKQIHAIKPDISIRQLDINDMWEEMGFTKMPKIVQVFENATEVGHWYIENLEHSVHTPYVLPRAITDNIDYNALGKTVVNARVDMYLMCNGVVIQFEKKDVIQSKKEGE